MPNIASEAVAGPFKAFYKAPSASYSDSSLTQPASLGVIAEKGIRQIRTFDTEEYTSDLLGSSVIEGVYMGGNMFLEFELEEANLNAVKALMNPYVIGQTGGAASNADPDPSRYVGVPGTFSSSYCGSLILRPLYAYNTTKHTRAAQQQTPVRVYGLVTIAGGFQQEQLFASKRRTIPMRLRCFPYSDGGSPIARYIWFSLQALTAVETGYTDTYQVS